MKGRDVAPVPGGTSIRDMDLTIRECSAYLLRHIIKDDVDGSIFISGTGDLLWMGGIDSILGVDAELISGSISASFAPPRFFFFAIVSKPI